MGLRGVELVLQVEEKFQIEIPDAAAAKIATVRDLVDFIAARVSHSNWPRERVFAVTRDIIVELLDVDPARVTEQAHLVDDLGAD